MFIAIVRPAVEPIGPDAVAVPGSPAIPVLTPRALYSPTTPDTLWEQHLGGGIMLVAGGMSYLAGGLWLAMQGLTRREAQAS